MGKKKKNQNSQKVLQDMLLDGIIANDFMADNKSDCLQQAEANERQREQKRYFQVLCEVMKLSKSIQNIQEEIQEIRKHIKDSERTSAARDKFEHDIKKRYKKNFKKADNLCQVVDKQNAKLKKRYKQQEELAKTVCHIAAVLGVGNASQDLHKIQKRCIKEIERRNEIPCLPKPNRERIIEGTYREV